MDDPCYDVVPLVKLLDPSEHERLNTVILQIDGMNCGNCANRVRNALLGTYGVASVTIDQPQGLGEVCFNPGLTSTQTLLQAVSAAGGDGFHHYAACIIS